VTRGHLHPQPTSDIRWLHLPASFVLRPSAEFFCSLACPAARQCVHLCAWERVSEWVAGLFACECVCVSVEGHVQVRPSFQDRLCLLLICAFSWCTSAAAAFSLSLGLPFDFTFHIEALKMHMPWLLHIRHVFRSHLIFMKNRARSSNKPVSQQTSKQTELEKTPLNPYSWLHTSQGLLRPCASSGCGSQTVSLITQHSLDFISFASESARKKQEASSNNYHLTQDQGQSVQLHWPTSSIGWKICTITFTNSI